MFSFFKKNKNPELVKLEEPTIEPLTIDEVKRFVRITGDYENNTIQDLIKSARQDAERYMKSSILKQKWRLSFKYYVDNEIEMPMGPVISIDEINIIGKDGSESLFNSSFYQLSPAKYFLFFDKIPSGRFITIDYFTGFGETLQSVPAQIKTALLNQVAYLYENRNKVDLNPASREVFNLYRRVLI
ncbi:MAG: phage head-tail connector protein [Rickettsiales bacterium]|nr:phage head-tail connector protein [Rickettsiales bacterium]